MSIVWPLGTTKSALTVGAHSKIARKLPSTIEDFALTKSFLLTIILLLKNAPLFLGFQNVFLTCLLKSIKIDYGNAKWFGKYGEVGKIKVRKYNFKKRVRGLNL
jgi:hypothetical protein